MQQNSRQVRLVKTVAALYLNKMLIAISTREQFVANFKETNPVNDFPLSLFVLQGRLLISPFPTKYLQAFILSSVRTICPVHLIYLHFVITTTVFKEYKS
jgi:hypothetical protein